MTDGLFEYRAKCNAELCVVTASRHSLQYFYEVEASVVRAILLFACMMTTRDLVFTEAPKNARS
jgi:hypothetical protein